MSSRLLAVWERAQSSYWFYPSVMALAAILLSFGTIWLDGEVGDAWLRKLGWLYMNKAEGARTLLGTIAGSMIGVAGVTFSITIAAFAQATTQFGPRLISNFMRDTGNQLVLGTFVATFVYSLMVLRTIQASGETAPAFVPHLSISFALVLALGSVGVLIYFIHHIPESINISNMVASIGRDLANRLERLGADGAAAQQDDVDAKREACAAAGRSVRAEAVGYIQRTDDDRLLRLAREQGGVFVFRAFPGDFVRRGDILGWFSADDASSEMADKCAQAFVVGAERSPTQDPLFLIDELVEVAGRALSPGVNDVFTAMGCIDWLGNGLSVAAARDVVIGTRFDADGKLRLLGRRLDFTTFLSRCCDRLRPYAERDPNAALSLLQMLASIVPALRDCGQKKAVLDQAVAVRDGALAVFHHPRNREPIEREFKMLQAATADSAG